MQIVNWGLMKHPTNWLTVVLMVMIGGAALHFVIQHITMRPDTDSSSQ